MNNPGECTPTPAAHVLCDVVDGVADVRLNRPERLNALDDGMFAELIATGERLRDDPGVRAVVLSGTGRSFCAGLDVSAFQAQADGRPWRPHEVARREESQQPADDDAPDTGDGDFGVPGLVLGRGQKAVWVWQVLDVPVIAAIQGHALGGGLQLALGADIRLVAPDARLGVLELEWGLTQDMTGTQVLPRLVGLDVAKDLTFSARRVTGEEAVRLGLATRVCDAPRDEALALAASIAARNPDAVRDAKRLLNHSLEGGMREGFRAERSAMERNVGSDNQRHAVREKLKGRS
ncbi:enoyl-CoA hydratase-related protein [Yinghuangia sp. ASG 101]|uniref:enoyl-CoA hydratase-related protein n=1 Tax=Yinghuangia sp. ASG 101 TaxID=2896848 RepID=UPI001E52DF48|nr:enoyl-CoA hydratase-related protein [Yinghuangia sp. ASG 101]UGQ11179.1 enoyl-CoA hydratase-related protein [Yinghuangia sp. ASG 101]